MLHLQQLTDSGEQIEEEAQIKLDYSNESKPVEWQNKSVEEDYNFISEVSRYFNIIFMFIIKKNKPNIFFI